MTQEFKATAIYSDNSEEDLTEMVIWSSADPLIASVSEAGAATALQAGTTAIIATYDSLEAAAELTVTTVEMPPPEPHLVSIAITAPSLTAYLHPATGVQLTATGTYSDGSTDDVTALVQWSSSNTAITAPAATPGAFDPAAVGTAQATATLDGVTQQAAVTVDYCAGDANVSGIVAGSGTVADPYQICSLAGLNAIRTRLTSNFKMIADIDLSSLDNFIPIGQLDGQGSIYYQSYMGVFDGGFHKIRGLTLNDPLPITNGHTMGGLFAELNFATLKNLGFEATTIRANIAGAIGPSISQSTIQNVYVSQDSYIGGTMAGGIASSIGHTTVRDSYVLAQIDNLGATILKGGIAYSIYNNSTIQNCYTRGANEALWSVKSAGATVTTSGTYYLSNAVNNSQPTALLLNFMYQQASFVGFDFTSTWMMPEQGGSPILRGF